MASQRLLAIVGGKMSEYAALQASSGAASAGAIPALNAAGSIDVTMLPSGIGPDVQVLTASEAIGAGAWVNIWSNGGAFAVRNADGSTTGKQADGYVLAAIASGAAGTVYLGGINTGVSGQAPGLVYLGTTAGQGSAAPAAAAGQTFQQIGLAVSPTAVQFDPQAPIARA